MHADLGHVRLVRKRHRLVEQLTATDDPDFTAIETIIRNGFLTGQIKRIVQTVDHGRSRRRIRRIVRDHDIVSIWQRTILQAQGFPRLTPHDDRMRDGKLLETLHVFGQMPRHTTLKSDGAVMTFLVTSLRPNQIHRERLGEIITPILLVLKPGMSGLGFVIATAATVMLHFTHSLKLN